ncbi:MAG: methyltransferase domain-containing protein [Candidatus Manganitrophus sp.]|nr:methyltransferase domain-containing protein [Candidatus Manganitrophus sp.]
MPAFKKGKALEVACGFGRNAFYLASQGFEVMGLDRDPEAVAFCNAEANRRGLSFTARAVDLEQPTPIPGEGYARGGLLLLSRSEPPSRDEAGRSPGGHLVYETFLIDQHERFGKPGRKEFCWGHNELLRLFLDFRILFYFEGFKGDRWMVQLIAERPG